MRRALFTAGLLVAFVVALVLAGRHFGGPRVVEAGSVRVLVAGDRNPLSTRTEAGFGIQGTVTVDEGGCVVLQGASKRYRTLLIWPSATEVVGRGAGVQIQVGSRHIALDQTVDLSAVDFSSDVVRDMFGEAASRCHGDDVVQVVED